MFSLKEVWQKAKKLKVQTTYGNYVIAEGFDGARAWKSGNNAAIALKADEAEQIKREAELFANADLSSVYAKFEFRLVDKIEGREVYLVIATTAGNQRERLYFDAQTGLLVRRSASAPTILGNYVLQVDYADYKDFGGVKLPTRVHFALPQIRWTRQILEVKNNVALDDKRFSPP